MKSINTCCVLFLFMCSCLAGSSHGDVENVLESFEFRLEEIQKIGTIEITDKDLSTEKWGGEDFDKLPCSAAKAVISAKRALKKWGCDPKVYFVTECSLVRVYRLSEAKEWYWSITFADSGAAPASVYPVLTIPVLLTGKVPNANFKEIERE